MKIDLKKDLKALYQPGSADFTEVEVPPRDYLALDGHGDPNTSPDYAAAVSALYASGYAVKSALRARSGEDFVVGPLEGLWTSSDPTSFADRRKGEWDWTMLIPLPDVVSAEDVAQGLAVAAGKKPELPVDQVRHVVLEEGDCLQIMHLGSFDDEGPVLARLHHEVMPARGLTFNGPHHEIYLSDPRRVAPERMRTVLRQPVCPVA
ncbi:GyrI-like domain-containing protein [Ornithinimicrobium cryptoxanthini]|uniref:GyrI-like domain-containing protein n=1 Tax=Ornithinimicrobium cryptoxanthini TaxID=2934161 RepID=A0ABY4YFN1_9MICO|nr:GyrI-like domain-containing protein [Ornithinimicrobium cryptoxanthini]USQ75571.1 GyrI-like domain-containing protein [Ornithinimicrobium cryptoxanthini]